MDDTHERIVLAGGCFWGMQDLFRREPGIVRTQVGYTGGTTANASYDQVKTGQSGHAEAVEIVFDSVATNLRNILEFFFQIHDPTTIDQQGNDRGSQYRSAIYYTSDEQKRIAQNTISDVEASGIWPGNVVTELAPAAEFWIAEAEHQNYLARIPHGYTCHFPRPQWRLPKRSQN